MVRYGSCLFIHSTIMSRKWLHMKKVSVVTSHFKTCCVIQKAIKKPYFFFKISAEHLISIKVLFFYSKYWVLTDILHIVGFRRVDELWVQSCMDITKCFQMHFCIIGVEIYKWCKCFIRHFLWQIPLKRKKNYKRWAKGIALPFFFFLLTLKVH